MSKISMDKTINKQAAIANKVKRQTLALAKQKLDAAKQYLSEPNEDIPKALMEIEGAAHLVKPFTGKK